MDYVYQAVGAFLLMYAITDYATQSIEIIFSGIALVALAIYFFPVAGLVPVAGAIFVITMILMIRGSKWTLIGAIALIPVSVYYMVTIQDPRVSGLLWMLIGAAFGIIDNVFMKSTAPGDIIITIILFVAAGPLAIPVYVAQVVYGKLFFERDYYGQRVYPMGTAVFVGYLTVAWALKYLVRTIPWILP